MTPLLAYILGLATLPTLCLVALGLLFWRESLPRPTLQRTHEGKHLRVIGGGRT